MSSHTVSDPIRAAWPEHGLRNASPSQHNETSSRVWQLYERVSRFFHEPLAYRFLPALHIKQEGLADLDQERNACIASSEGKIERMPFLTADGVTLDGAILWNNKAEAEDSAYHKRAWILYFNGNGETYEDSLRLLSWYGQETDCNVICFNYRGVGYSESTPYRASDLSLDGDAVFQFLLRHHVPSERILIHGRSLGGAIGTSVRSMHPEGPLCNERSFDRSQNVYKNLYEKVCAAFMGWEFDPITDWQPITGKKWVIVSPTDEVIDYETASFYRGLAKISDTSLQVIHLPAQYSWPSQLPVGHNIRLNYEEYASCWAEHKKLVKDCFK